MGLFTKAAFSWAASKTYDNPEEGVDYTSLDYMERSDIRFGVPASDIGNYVSYIRGAIRQAKTQGENSWMEEVSTADIKRFASEYVMFYDGSVSDCWFFFKYHYREYIENPLSVFRLYPAYVRATKNYDDLVKEDLLRFFPKYEAAHYKLRIPASKEEYEITGINILNMINDMDRTYFDICRTKLYPFLHFETPSTEEISRDDLAERILTSLKIEAGLLQFPAGNIMWYYAFTLGFWLKMQIKVEEGSRAAQYYNLAFDKMKMIRVQKDVYPEMMDLLSIFLSFARELNTLRKTYDNPGQQIVFQNLDISVLPEDIEQIDLIKDNISIPIFIAKYFDKTIKHDIDSKICIQSNKKIFYILTMVFYCHMMSEFYIAGEEETNG